MVLFDHAQTTISSFNNFLKKKLLRDRNYPVTGITPRDPTVNRGPEDESEQVECMLLKQSLDTTQKELRDRLPLLDIKG